MASTISIPAASVQAEPAEPSAGGSCIVDRLSDREAARWDAYVLGHGEGTLFHSLAWRNAVSDVFGHAPIYLTATRDGRIVGVLPLFHVASRIAGNFLASVPYGVGGGILADDSSAAHALSNEAVTQMIERRCGCIDYRSRKAVVPQLATIDRYVGFERELPDTAEDVLGWLPRKARAVVRNARSKYGLEAMYGDEHLKNVWWMYTMSMRRLASLSYPFSFFRRLIDETPGKHWVTTLRWRGRIVAGLVTFLFRDRVMPYFIGTTNLAKRCGAANLIYACVMERGVAAGYRIFDFGRSRRDNAGSYNFKRFNGFEPKPLAYQCHQAPGCPPPNLTPTNPKYRLARRVWPHLPLFVTRRVGAMLAKHIPG